MFHSSKTLCTSTNLSNFWKVTVLPLRRLSFSVKGVFSFGAINSSKCLQWLYGLAEDSWLIKFELHLMALRTNNFFWNSIPTKKQSLIFCFVKDSSISWHRSFSFLSISSIIINWCTLHKRVDGTESTLRSSQTWNVGISHQEYITRNIEL